MLLNCGFIAGCPRVDGDEEDDIDDADNEFNFAGRGKQDMQYLAESMLQGHMSYGCAGDIVASQAVHTTPQVPLLTNGEMVLPSTWMPILHLFPEILFFLFD